MESSICEVRICDVMRSVLSIWYWYRSGDNVALENEVSEFIEVQFSEVRLVVNGERF